MKLLIITQTIDRIDPILGFFHRWVEEFAKHCDRVIVICLKKGEYKLPANVQVLSLGKETGRSRLKYLWRFYRYLWQERHGYDRVFVHMNPEYILLAGWWWRLSSKKIIFWYTHRQANRYLWLAEKYSHYIFSAVPSSFTLKSKKVNFVGHGIDVNRFKCYSQLTKTDSPLIITVGRITPIKNCESLIEAAKIITDKGKKLTVNFIGSPVNDKDKNYQAKLTATVRDYGLESIIYFIGSVSNNQIHDYYCRAQVSVNMAPTGGLDKTVIESMAAGLPVLVANIGFENYFGSYSDKLIFRYRDARDLAAKLMSLMTGDNIDLGRYLQGVAEDKFSIDNLITTILSRET